jgi:hypothetical protein
MTHPVRSSDYNRRLELVERDLDRLLDPETGIYVLLNAMESRLKSVAIMVLIGVLLNLILMLAGVHAR